MARSHDDYDRDDEFVDRPIRRRRRKQSSNLGLVFGLIAVGVLALVGVGIIGVSLLRGGGGGGLIGGLLPHPAHAMPVTEATFTSIEVEDPQTVIERKLGPGAPLSMTEAQTVIVPAPARRDLRGPAPNVPLASLGERPPPNASVTSWYQYGSGASRLFLGYGPSPSSKEPILLAKYYLHNLPGGGHTQIYQQATLTLTFGPPPGAPQSRR